MKPETLSTKDIYKGKKIDLRVDTLSDDGAEYEREIVVHKGSSVIIPVFNDKSIVLARQYRHAAGKYLLEIAAGSLEEGEDPETGAIRELEEEIGVVAGKIELISEFYVSPGFLTEKMYLFLATELTETAQNLDEHEHIDLQRMTFPEAFDLIRSGGIEDAKTIIGVTLAGARFGFSL